jgi:hypothetical protein
MKPIKDYLKILISFLAVLLIGGSWWATEHGWALPRLQLQQRPVYQDCPPWQRDAFNNCPPKTHRLQLGEREYQDNRGK